MTKAAGIGLVLLTLWAYQSVWSAGWVYEDWLYVRATSGPIVTRPITSASWRLTTTPRQAHAVSLTLHLLAGALVTAFAWRLGLRRGAAAAAVIWLLHPLLTETAAYAASRGELLALIGVLLACLSATAGWWRLWPALGIAAGLVLACLSKESGVVGFLLVPLTIAATDAQARPRRASPWIPATVSAAGLVAGVAWFGGVRTVANFGGTDFIGATAIGWRQWALLQAAAAHYWIGAYVWLSGLTPDPDIDRVPVSLQLGSLACLGVIALLAWRLRTRVPIAAFGLAWCLLALAPRFLVQMPQGYLNAHQFTVPMVGLVLATATAYDALARWAQS